MKNLFDYATKELSQDAFLRWLFENYDCEDNDVRKVSRQLIVDFLDKEIAEDEIISLWTKAQDHKLDISMCVNTKKGNYGILIEDKTFSGEHNQLKKYKDIFEGDEYWLKNTEKRKYIFYKTGKIYDYEKDEIEKNCWKLYDINKIVECFSKYEKKSTNLLLQNYASHVRDLYNRLNNKVKPTGEDSDILKWEGFFNSIRERVVKDNTDFVDWIGSTYYGYAYFCFRHKVFESKKGGPYLEIRSRDCLKDAFQCKILTYGMDDNKNFSKEECTLIRDNIETIIKNKYSDIFKINNQHKRDKDKKQIASLKKEEINIIDENHFIEKINKYLKIFKDIIENINFN